jgi:hypothetical protein
MPSSKSLALWSCCPRSPRSCRSSLPGVQRAGYFLAIVRGISPRVKSKIFLMALPLERGCRRSSARIKRARIGIVSILICSGTVLPYGVLIAACPWAISKISLGMCLWPPRAYTLRPARTIGERHICGQSCQFPLRERKLDN